MFPDAFIEQGALIVVDIQAGARRAPLTEAELPAPWRALGFRVEDVNAAETHAWEVCLPNAVRAAGLCRELGIPRIFLHWGFRCADGADLDPDIYQTMRAAHGPDARAWPGHIASEETRPAAALAPGPRDHVIAKTGQDAFTSSPLGFVLRNLGVEWLVFTGGHTEACLGKTARSARRLGYRTLCIEDATNNARASTRFRGILRAGFEHVTRMADFEARAAAVAARKSELSAQR